MTPFVVVECDQRSEAWRTARLGRLTSSVAADMLATIKSGAPSASRRNLLTRLVLERLTGRSHESGFQSAAMQQGVDREAEAYGLYEALTGRVLQRSGFLHHPTLFAGASLDGHVGDFAGIVEIKSPLAATHLEYLRTGVVPGDYLKQCTHALWITGAAWCDWFSYNPDFPDHLQMKIVRIEVKDLDLRAYEKAARAFLAEVDREVEAVRTLSNVGAVLQQVAGL
jgi:hypothetical protein